VCETGQQPNDADDGCEPCVAGKYSSTNDNSVCASCDEDTFSEVGGAASADVCLPCEEGTTSSSGASSCSQVFCFTAYLVDSFGDGWGGDKLWIKDEASDKVLHELQQSCYAPSPCASMGITANVPESFEDICFVGCGNCYVGELTGFDNGERSWYLLDGEDAEVAGSEGSGMFCTEACQDSVCGPGEQPNAEDDGCDPCVYVPL
jgi:hypothetical protein